MQNTVVIVNEVEAVALEKLSIDGCEPPGDCSSEDTGKCLQESELHKSVQYNVPAAEGTSNVSTPDRPLLRSVSLASELTGISSEGTWKKTIQVGPDYQAVVPEGPCYSEVDTRADDRLLWDPKKIEEHEVDNYLREVHGQHYIKGQGLGAIPVGNHIRDDEQALFLLVQCGYDVKEALRRRSMQQVCPVSTMSLWSEEECRSFETGLKTYGKNFHLIQRFKLRSRSVGDLVHFYYLWKKTERHDIFVSKNKIGKKKCTQLGTMRLHGEKLFPLSTTGAGKRCHDCAIFKSMILDVDPEFLVS